MKSPALDPQLAWALWYELAKWSFLLWEGYQKDFLRLAEEEKAKQAKDTEEELEIEIPFYLPRVDKTFDERARAITWRLNPRPRVAQSWASHLNFEIWIKDDGWLRNGAYRINVTLRFKVRRSEIRRKTESLLSG